MKKIMVALLICSLFLAGCGHSESSDSTEHEKKQSKIEIYSVQDDKLLKTIDDQDTVNRLLETYNWETVESLSTDLIPEYKMLVYQEKTLLHGQDPNEERDYELIETVITFQDSPYIAEIISSDVIKNIPIPEDIVTFYYVMPDDIQKELYEITGN